ncbi:unnamed protein product [Nezara viridula]|uniref:Glucose-methanol-choline oxidoreductase N-terminal domain-containing protein n=1 Tax=Nezara viridula TaxID=85310 RepID=A0A9P0HHS6_NEZVI|nr:unnamed protein product [Nezara viridula]
MVRCWLRSSIHQEITLKLNVVTMWILAILLYVLDTTDGQRSFLEEIQRQYLKQGIPFRENIYIDNLPVLQQYDFIIVGSGPTGSVIANRLSEVPYWNILLLEKGLEGNFYNDLPFTNPFLVLGDFSVMIDVEREENVCLGLVDKRCHWPSGNGVGGATLINGMMYTRGHPSDYDSWALAGNPGWSFSEVLPYFLKSENMSISTLAGSPYHSTNGPLHIDSPFTSKLGKLFLKAGEELGYPIVDYNNPETMEGFSTTQITAKRGRRHSAATAFLLPVKSRTNLHIVKNAFVTEILISPSTKKAYGVKYLKNNKERTVRATNEVIVSAGAFDSPKLLMLSGIGPRNDLKSMKIPIIADLPVGKNLQEHLGTPVLMFLINTTDSYNVPKLLRTMPIDFIQWYSGVKNIYANNGAEAISYMMTKYAEGKPDIELILAPSSLIADDGLMLRKTVGITDEVYFKTWGKLKYAESFQIAPLMMYPRSRGELRLRSRNPKDPPLIDGNFFADSYDIKVMIEAIRAAIKITETNTFRKIGAKLYQVPLFGCEQFTFNSDDYWECAIRSVPVQYHHQSGTCRMGPERGDSVVDPRLRVHGVAGLRVADASIMPVMPGVHTMAACYMIGEKAADMIKEDWGFNNL